MKLLAFSDLHRTIIAAKQPKLGLCGHIHATKIRNLGPAPVWFDL